MASKNKKPGLMTGQLPLPLVPIETIPIGDAAGIYEDEHGGAILSHCANNLHPRRPVTQRPIYPCDSRSKIDTASLELYLPCQEAWSPVAAECVLVKRLMPHFPRGSSPDGHQVRFSPHYDWPLLAGGSYCRSFGSGSSHRPILGLYRHL